MIRSVLINFRFPWHAGNIHILEILDRSLNSILDFHQKSITKNYFEYFKISNYVYTIGNIVFEEKASYKSMLWKTI